MTAAPPRLRMFAGPNGSGKTTVKRKLQRPPAWFGLYINPDELEESIRTDGHISLRSFEFALTTEEVQYHFENSTLLRQHNLQDVAKSIECEGGILAFRHVAFNSYHASALADLLRRKALGTNLSFTFETVMSSPDKIELLREAKARGFRTYLYYIATEDPAINLQRVKLRTLQGGHDVPEEKVVSRYARSLGLLVDAIRQTDRSYFFDTSENQAWYFAEATDGRTLELKSQEMPEWFRPIWNEF